MACALNMIAVFPDLGERSPSLSHQVWVYVIARTFVVASASFSDQASLQVVCTFSMTSSHLIQGIPLCEPFAYSFSCSAWFSEGDGPQIKCPLSL